VILDGALLGSREHTALDTYRAGPQAALEKISFQFGYRHCMSLGVNPLL
jgi:hypothetical protein